MHAQEPISHANVERPQPSELYIYWNDNCGSNFEANMAEIEARLVGMIQAPTRKFTQFRMKNLKNRHSFFGKSFLFLFYCVLSRALLHHQETKTSSLSEQVNFRNTLS